MSTAHVHPATVQQPARTVPPAVLALIAVAAFAIGAFAIGQAGISIGGTAVAPAPDAAAASQTEAYRQQRLGEMTTGERIVVRTPTDSRLRRTVPAAFVGQVELQKSLAYQAWAEYMANLQKAQQPVLHEEGSRGFRGGR